MSVCAAASKRFPGHHFVTETGQLFVTETAIFPVSFS